MTTIEPVLLDSPAARPCLCRRVTHEHGTTQAYQSDRCRCRSCSDANAAYQRGRYAAINHGRWNVWVDAAPVREHVRGLMAHLGWRAIADEAHLNRATVKMLLYGQPSRGRSPSRRLRRKTAAALFAVTAGHQGVAEGAELWKA